ncbi:hypothetical protein SAMN05421774_11063 [Gemmobacter megaterium]|uniref:Uncharacterized protein n=1 Tax=Gemmobacter megaterium TaxID=1086013 RepID=A0A1N7QG02_9RHOB|nr:hypothetical protein [Gemmobacter megaterium]GGE25588.1 hypothetical protein GCM10011345_34410 [Gemmobacter megaterium]SIT21792.1 hypothetical protein SAMN05421774_11063 [Gemmobacter megaterium]
MPTRTAPPGTVTFLCLAGTPPESLATALAARCPDWSGQVHPLTAPLAASAAPYLETDGRIVVVHAGWQDWLLAAMAAGRDPGPALEDWVEQTEALLALHRGNRRRMLLVPAGLLDQPDAEGLCDLARWAGLDPDQVTAEAPGGLPAPSALHIVLARQAFAGLDRARGTALAFEAASLPLPDPRPEGHVPDAAFAELTRLLGRQQEISGALQATEQGREGLQTDNAELAGNLGTLQSELVRLTAAEQAATRTAARLKAENATLERELAALRDSARAELDALRASQATLQQTTLLTAENAGTLQSELVRLTAAEQTAARTTARLESEKAALERELAPLRDSVRALENTRRELAQAQQAQAAATETTGRVQAELAALRDQHAALQQTNGLMAENIGLCQSELVRLSTVEQAVSTERATLEHQIVTLRKAAEAEKSALERELVQAVRRMDRLSDNRQALALAQATIQRMTGEIRQLVDQQTRSAPPPQDEPAAQG